MLNLETRLYIELVPDENSKARLRKIVQEIRPLVKARFIDESKWHVTIMHFGIASQVFTELQDVSPDLSKAKFLKALGDYIERSKKSLPAPTQLKTESYELLGGRNNVLAIRFEMTPQIQQDHMVALTELKRFFADVSLDEPEAFMRKSQNFSWALTVKPHLTLARGVIHVDIDELPLKQSSLNFLGADIHGI